MRVFDQDGTVVGYAAVQDDELKSLYVDPAAQGAGVGRPAARRRAGARSARAGHAARSAARDGDARSCAPSTSIRRLRARASAARSWRRAWTPCAPRVGARRSSGASRPTGWRAPSTSATAGSCVLGEHQQRSAPEGRYERDLDGRPRRRHRSRRRALPPAHRRARGRGRRAPGDRRARGARVGGRTGGRGAAAGRHRRARLGLRARPRRPLARLRLPLRPRRRRGGRRHAVGGRGRRRAAARGPQMDRQPCDADRAEWYGRQQEEHRQKEGRPWPSPRIFSSSPTGRSTRPSCWMPSDQRAEQGRST